MTTMRPTAAPTPHPIASLAATALGPEFELIVAVVVALRLVPDCVVLVAPRRVDKALLLVPDGAGVCDMYGVVGEAL